MKDYIHQNEIPRINKFFSVFFAIYPILCIYKGFSSFTVGDIILIFFCVLSLFETINIDDRLLTALTFIGFAAFSIMCNILFSMKNGNYNMEPLLLRFLKLFFYMLCVFTTGKQFFDFRIFKRVIYIVAIMATAFIFLQYIAYYAFGKIVLGQIPNIPLYLEEYSSLDYDKLFDYKFRPSSFFLEPAMFCQYIVVALTISIFSKQDSKELKIILSAVFTMGILMSAAGQGIVYLIIVYGIYIFTVKNALYTIISAVFAFVAAKISYDKIEAVKMAVDRLFNQNAQDARLSSYSYCFSLEGIHSLFGYGYGSTANNEYMSGAAYVWYGCGIIGLLLAILLFYSFYRSADNHCSKTICLLFFVMFLCTSLFYNYMLYWYFSLMILTTHKYIISTESENSNEVSLYSGGVQAKGVG